MKHLIIIILFLLQGTWLLAQEKKYIHKGNELYQQQKYKEAEADYRKSVDQKSQDVAGNFNLGDALYKQKKFADAGEQFNKLAGSANQRNGGPAAACSRCLTPFRAADPLPAREACAIMATH